MLKRKQVASILSIAVISSLIGTSFGILRFSKADAKSPFDDVWEAIFELEAEMESMNQTIQSLKESVETLKFRIPCQPYSFLIYSKDGAIEAIDRESYVRFNGTNARIVINDALSALSPGRNWQEKVVVKGSYILDGPLTIPSYTILDLSESRFKLKDNVGGHVNMIENSDPAGGNQYITILGGILDGNRGNNWPGGYNYGINFYTISNSEVIGTKIVETTHDPVFFQAGENCLVSDVVFGNTYGHGVYFKYMTQSIMTNLVGYNTEMEPFVLGCCSGCILSDSIAMNSGRSGIYISLSQGCLIDNVRLHKIKYGGVVSAGRSSYNMIQDCYLSDIGGSAIFISSQLGDSIKNAIADCKIVNTSLEGVGLHPMIQLVADGGNNILDTLITGCVGHSPNASYGVEEAAPNGIVDYTEVHGNNFRIRCTGCVKLIGSNSVSWDNL